MKLSGYEFPLFLAQAKCDAFRRIEFTIRFKKVPTDKKQAKLKKMTPSYFKEEPLFAGRMMNVGAGKILSEMNREDIKKMRKTKHNSSYTFYLKGFKDIETFDTDMANWLEEMDEICPLQFVLRDETDMGKYRYQGGEWTHVSDSLMIWHKKSTEYANVTKLLNKLEKDPETYKQKDDEKRLFSYCVKALISGPAFKEEIFSLDEGSKLEDFITGREKIKFFFEKRDPKSLIKIITENHSGKYVDVMIYEDLSSLFSAYFFDSKNPPQAVIKFFLKLAKALHPFKNAWELCFPFGSSLAPLSKYAALNKDEDLLKKMALYTKQDFRGENYVKEFGYYAWLLMKEKKFKEAIELFKIALNIEIEKPVSLDLSVYCNALWVLLIDNTNLSINPKLNRLFLKKCLPHAPQNPAIYCNAANMYAQMGEMEKAYKYFLLTKENDEKSYQLMIKEIKTMKSLAGFRKFLENKIKF